MSKHTEVVEEPIFKIISDAVEEFKSRYCKKCSLLTSCTVRDFDNLVVLNEDKLPEGNHYAARFQRKLDKVMRGRIIVYCAQEVK